MFALSCRDEIGLQGCDVTPVNIGAIACFMDVVLAFWPFTACRGHQLRPEQALMWLLASRMKMEALRLSRDFGQSQLAGLPRAAGPEVSTNLIFAGASQPWRHFQSNLMRSTGLRLAWASKWPVPCCEHSSVSWYTPQPTSRVYMSSLL